MTSITNYDFRLPDGHGAACYGEIDSTNAEAKRNAAEGMAGNRWCIAATQTAGRGRRGRSWISEPGNVYASLLLRPDCQAGEAAALSFVAGLAVRDAIDTIAGGDTRPSLKLKWPNDVLCNGRKISGILLESSARADGAIDWVVIGVGINVAHHPDDLPFPATSLVAEGLWAAGPGPVFDALAANMDRWLQLWRKDGFGPVREAWMEHAAFKGERISVSARDGKVEGKVQGRFGGLTRDGALLLEMDDQTVRMFPAGDVFPFVEKET